MKGWQWGTHRVDQGHMCQLRTMCQVLAWCETLALPVDAAEYDNAAYKGSEGAGYDALTCGHPRTRTRTGLWGPSKA